MNKDIKIITTYDNQRVQLVFNESFLCPEKNSLIDIELGENVTNWKLRLKFEDTPGETPYHTKWEFTKEGFDIIGTFFKWAGSSWVELGKPITVIDTANPKTKLFIKVRTEMNESKPSFQKIHLSIWKVV